MSNFITTRVIRVLNNTTVFGEDLSKGSIIYDITQSKVYMLTSFALATETLKAFIDAGYTINLSGGTSTSTGLERITEGGHTGWVLTNRVAANYGEIGSKAVDFSFFNAASTTHGATGAYSFANSFANTAAGEYSVVLGGHTNVVPDTLSNVAIIASDTITAKQSNTVYLPKIKYKGYTSAEIAAFSDSELGTMVYDSTLDAFLYCSDETAGANIWHRMGAENITDLDDIPNSLTGQSGKVLAVDSTGTIMEFIALSGGGVAPTGLEKVDATSTEHIGTMPAANVFLAEGDVSKIYKLNSKVVLTGSPTQPDFKTTTRTGGYADPTTTIPLNGMAPATDYTHIAIAGVGWKFVDNPSTSTGLGAVNLMSSGDAPQNHMVYVSGIKYKSYSTAEIAIFPDSQLGTVVFDSSQNKLSQCTNATPGANVWGGVGGDLSQIHQELRKEFAGTLVAGTIPAYTFTIDATSGDVTSEFPDNEIFILGGGGLMAAPYTVGTATFVGGSTVINFVNPYPDEEIPVCN
jgi:hypothetical protein